jgi:hypothetical protein
VKSLSWAGASLCLLLLLIGCDSGPPVVHVTGVATRGGQPVKNLFVKLYPEGAGRGGSGITDDQGRFELKVGKNQNGATVGTHKVVVSFRPRSPQEEADLAEGKVMFHPDQNAILEKYGTLERTKMTVEITKATENLELKFD